MQTSTRSKRTGRNTQVQQNISAKVKTKIKKENVKMRLKKKSKETESPVSRKAGPLEIRVKNEPTSPSVDSLRPSDVLKFDHVVVKVDKKEMISIPEYPDIQIKLVKGGKHPYMCHKCDLGFWTKKSMKAHASLHTLKKAKPRKKKFRCDFCSKGFSKLCDLERHTRVHTGEKPCICNICNKRFQQTHNLSKHLLTHLRLKPFVCDFCKKQFGRNDVLRRHLLTHSREKPVKCGVCLKGFIRHTQLLQHYKTKHPDQNIDDLPQPFIEVDEYEVYVKKEVNEDTEEEERPAAQSSSIGE